MWRGSAGHKPAAVGAFVLQVDATPLVIVSQEATEHLGPLATTSNKKQEICCTPHLNVNGHLNREDKLCGH